MGLQHNRAEELIAAQAVTLFYAAPAENCPYCCVTGTALWSDCRAVQSKSEHTDCW